MSYTLLDPQPGPRADTLSYDQAGPGLYPDETALLLDDGTLVAVSVTPKWLDNGGGVDFKGYARWIEADGTTKLDAFGQHVEVCLSHAPDAVTVQQFGVPKMAKDVLLTMLGETRELVVHEEGAEPAVITAWSSDFLANVRIRDHIAIVDHTGPNAIDPTSLLGL